MFRIIASCPVFSGLDESECSRILSQVQHFNRTYVKGAIIASKGECCTKMMILLSGCISCEMTDFSGKRIEIEKIRPPGIIAPAFIFGKNNRYPVDVICIEDTEILCIEKHSLIRIMQLSDVILQNYLDSISSKAQFLAQRLNFLSFKSINQKLAHYILHIAGEGSPQVTLPRNQTQLSEFFGVSRPALARIFNQMKQSGIIDYKGSRITILDRKRLADILHG